MKKPPPDPRRAADRHLGAIIGAGLGLLLAKGLPGAIIGAVAGHFAQRRLRAELLSGGSQRRASPIGGGARQSAIRVQSLVRLLVAMARTDGAMTDVERRSILSYFERDANMPAIGRSAVARLIDDEAAGPRVTPIQAAHDLRGLDPNDRLHVVFILFRVALADRTLGSDEDRSLRDVAREIGLTTDDFARIRSCFVDDQADPTGKDYEILGLTPGADPAAVKARYKEAAKTYHPDRFQHLGAEFAETAGEKFKAIHGAYERILSSNKTSTRPRASLCPNCRTFTSADEPVCIRCGEEKQRVKGDRFELRCPFCSQTNAFPKSGTTGVIRCGNCKVVLVR